MNATKKKARLALGVLLALGASFLGSRLERAFADRAPTAPPLTYSGTALMAGAPIADGSHMIGVTLHTRSTGVVGAVCAEAPAATTTSAGRFSVTFTDVACGNAIQQGTELYVEVSVDGTTLPRTRIGAVPYAVQAENGVPPGSIMAFAGETPPIGWIVCDGTALDGDDPRNAPLRAAIGTSWGTGTDDADAATDFNVPDLRGRFVRGFDDATTARDDDRDVRVESAPGGRTGAHVGTLEADAFQGHGHEHEIPNNAIDNPFGTFEGVNGTATYGGGRILGPTSYGAFGTARFGVETRPENAMVLYIIKL